MKKKEAPVVTQVQENHQPKQSAAAETTTINTSDNLLDGVYDEEANKEEFQNALLAWRNAGKKSESKDKPESSIKPPSSSQTSTRGKAKKSVRFAEEPPEEVLILNNEDEEAKEDDEAQEIKPNRKPTTEIKEGMIAFKGLSTSKNSFLYSEESSGSNAWNVDLMSTVDHAGTSTENNIPVSAPPPKVDKEL